jgi:lipid-A-disaccharide synthase
MVTFYKVTAASWLMGRMLVRVPFYSMVNLIAGRAVVPELMQSNLTGERLAAEAHRLLRDDAARAQMRSDLAEVAARLASQTSPMARASAIIQDLMEGRPAYVS